MRKTERQLNPLQNVESSIDEVGLYPNRPNPFSFGTIIRYSIDLPGDVTLQIHDLNGRLIFQHTELHAIAGEKQFRYISSNITPGNYTCTLLFNNGYSTVRLQQKMQLVK